MPSACRLTQSVQHSDGDRRRAQQSARRFGLYSVRPLQTTLRFQTFLECRSPSPAALPGTFLQPLPEPCRHLSAMRVSIEDKTEKCRHALISAELSQEGVLVSWCRRMVRGNFLDALVLHEGHVCSARINVAPRAPAKPRSTRH